MVVKNQVILLYLLLPSYRWFKHRLHLWLLVQFWINAR